MTLTRRSLILGLAALGAGKLQAKDAELQIIDGKAFGSSWRIVLEPRADIGQIRKDASAILAEVDAQMSPYRYGSALSVFNRSRNTDWLAMPADLCRVTAEAVRIAELTTGAFDPTVGPIVSRFGFGPIEGGAGDYTGIDHKGSALRKSAPDLTLDLCGIAKGYALDRVADMIGRSTNALIEIGGEVMALGNHPSGRRWAVAISDPGTTEFQAYRIIAPDRFALATSGHAVNGLAGPVSTSHIIDPRTGRPASHAILSVSVLAGNAMAADALATAFCAAGPQAGVALAQGLEIAALFILQREHEMFEMMTGTFARHVLA